MPPKRSGKGKKSAKSKTPTVIDGISTEEMTKEQLEEHIQRLREELDREREERNYFQLERDKVNTFWEITKRQVIGGGREERERERETDKDGQTERNETETDKQRQTNRDR